MQLPWLFRVIELLLQEPGTDPENDSRQQPQGEVQREVRVARPLRDLRSFNDPHRRGRQVRTRGSLHFLFEQGRVQHAARIEMEITRFIYC